MQTNAALFRRALWVALQGGLIGLAVAAFFGAANPGYEPSVEIESRGTPDLLDLAIALSSGMVAAIAISGSDVPSTLGGVDIAAALLIPPLLPQVLTQRVTGQARPFHPARSADGA